MLHRLTSISLFGFAGVLLAGLSLPPGMATAAAAGQATKTAVKVSEFIFEQAPFPQCHASTIVEVAPAKFLAAWFGGTREGAPDVGIWVSRNEHGRWGPPVQVATGQGAGDERHPTWNPVLFAPAKGPVLLFYKVGPSPSRWWGMVMSSDDGGATWSAPRRLPDGVLGPIKNKPVVLPGGTWLSPSSTEDPAAGWQVRFEISPDRGTTWEVVGPIDKGPRGLEAIQPSILFHPGRRLQAICRTRSGVLATTWSRDGGRSWEPLSASTLPNPNAGTDALTLADGRHLLVYNHSEPRPGARSGPRYPLNVAISPDGVTWTPLVTLEDQPLPDGYAYPAVIQSSDGLVHITYTWNRRRIKHVVLDPGVTS
ncbi:MAG TPA: sialidase family protein [Vicinamibacterales bacterium]|nr:sialidase family protein [Vicinamibacterales bacterium]